MVIIAHAGDPEKTLRQQREFYELLGRTISQWALVEDQIYHTYWRVIDPRDWAAAAAAYHSILNLNTKLGMIDAGLAVSRKYNSHLADWQRLRRKIRLLSARRAKLAHWTVWQDATQPGEAGVTIYLQAPLYDFRALGDDGERKKIGARQISQWASAFNLLGSKIENFWRQLS